MSNVSGAGESQAEGERGAGETAGPAGALQEVFDITQHSLGQGATQRAHAEVTPRGGLRSSNARRPSERKALEGGGHVLSPVSFSHWFQFQWWNFNEHLLKRLNPTATGDGSRGSPPFIPPVFAQTMWVQAKEMEDFTQSRSLSRR